MNEPTRATEKPIQISEDRDGQRPILLHPGDDDVFVRTGRQVIEACRLGISIELWMSELEAMLEHVRGWIDQHKSHVRSCYAAPRSARVALYFVPATERFDFDLADELAGLNADLVKRFNIGMVETHQVPELELERFINPNSAKQVYGEQQREAHRPVEA